MSEPTKPTPGPWTYERSNRPHDCPEQFRIWSAPIGDDTFAVAETEPCPEAEANARVMAAAPELLGALEHMRWCQSCAEGSWEDCDGGRAALAAIAKATGREQ